MFDDPIAAPVNFDQTVFESLFGVPLVDGAGGAEHPHATGYFRRDDGHLGGL